ncbi:AraC family transcriptional regulator [Bacteroides sp. 224]|uniref:AraC family transcriptional regulator n=1 Tax=Bacteroides sp. 224 TaxID=2302936 RepID=UPI0013D28A34|nr:AraC family transcriptional regulator [Bacteroides sp. 224]NDV64266.1 AraC family transcriptional regulator [Bacteroides sp. 224]
METIAEGFKGEKAIITPYNIRELQAKNKITKQMYVTHIGYYPHAKYHYRERVDGTNENILIYCEKGKGWVECGGERYHLTANQVFIIPEKAAHAYGANLQDPWSICWIHFQGTNVDMFQSIIGRPVSLKDSANSRHGERLLLFEEMFRNLEMGYSPENLEHISFCLMYFLASIKYLQQYREIKNVKVDDVVQKSILFMKENLENKITLEDIAREAGYSVSHLTTLFTQKTSYSPIVYYNQLRIQRACSYLQFTELKIKEIAFKLGFFDPFHFSKAFVKEMEITPKEYRKRYQERKE